MMFYVGKVKNEKNVFKYGLIKDVNEVEKYGVSLIFKKDTNSKEKFVKSINSNNILRRIDIGNNYVECNESYLMYICNEVFAEDFERVCEICKECKDSRDFTFSICKECK